MTGLHTQKFLNAHDGYGAFWFTRMRVLAALLLCLVSLWPALGFAQTSTLCPVLSATVAYGGSVSINAGSCHAGFGLGNIATPATHGTGSVGAFGPNQQINYAHNGTSGTTDFFVVRDGNSPPNNLIRVNITIAAPTSAIVVSPASLPAMTAGAVFSQALGSTGGAAPYTYSLSSGALPPGLSLTAGGAISGTPTQRGSYTFSVRSQDNVGAFTVKGYTGTVQNPSLALVPASATAIQGVPFSLNLSTSGGVAPHTYQLETGSFPSGIGISSAGVVSGTTSAAPGNYPVSLRVTDSSAGPGSYFEVEPFTLTVSPAPSVSIAVSPASVSEDGATNLVFTVTRSLNLSSSTTVNITTGGSATSGVDYTGAVTAVTIPAGATTATVVIDPVADATVEANETVILSIAAGSGYVVGAPAAATGTILNDDVPIVSIAVSPASVAEDGAANLVYTVTLNQPALNATSVNFTVGGTATSGSDYAAVTSPLTIAAGSTTGTITINPTADATNEPNETVIITLAAGAGYVVGAPSTATGTILNDDLPTLSINDVTVAEGNAGTSNATFTVSLSAPAGPGGVTFDIATANGSATAGVDYVAKTLLAQTIPAGSSTYSFTVLVNGDTLNEANETFFVNVTNVTNAIVADGQGVGTITNDDALPSLSINDVSVAEGNSGTASAVFTVSLSAASGQTVTVNYATADGTAVAPGDYTAASGTLTFAAGQTTRTITVLVNGDTAVETDETFTVGLSGAANATIADATGIGTITNDDALVPTVTSISPTAGPTAGGTTVTIAGTNFTGATAVSFGGTAATTFTVNSATQITATAPARAAGTVDITVTTPGGTSAANAADRYTYVAAPTVTSISPNQGPVAGGTTVTITGTGFAAAPGAGAVRFGTATATYTINSNTQITAVAPAGAVGAVDITVTTPGGTSATSAADRYTYAAAPVASNFTYGSIVPYNDGANAPTSFNLSSQVTNSPTSYAVGSATTARGGSVSVDSTGQVTYVPPRGYRNANDSFTYTATNAIGTSTPATVTLTIGNPTISLLAASLPDGTEGLAYSQAITASGGMAPYTYAITAGALPAGLTLSASGALSGTPTANGSFNFTVTATDSSTGAGPATASRAYTLVVAAPVAVPMGDKLTWWLALGIAALFAWRTRALRGAGRA